MDLNPINKDTIQLIPDFLRGELIVKLYFKYNKHIIEIINKTIPGRRWNQLGLYWYFPKKHFDPARLFTRLESIAVVDYSTLEIFDKGPYNAQSDIDKSESDGDFLQIDTTVYKESNKLNYPQNTMTN